MTLNKLQALTLGLALAINPASAEASDNPGDLFVGTVFPLLNGPYFNICGIEPFSGTFQIWGRVPDGGASRVAFEVTWAENVFPLGATIEIPGAVDLSAPGDDV